MQDLTNSPDMARLILQCPRLLIFGWRNWVLIRMGIALSQNATAFQLLLQTKTWLFTDDICYHKGLSQAHELLFAQASKGILSVL